MPQSAEIHVLENETALAREVGDFLAWSAEETLRRCAQFRLVLSGGSTPRTLYRTLSSSPLATRFEWPRIRFFFGDERCVPPTHTDSNFAMAKAALFDPLGVADHQISRMRGEDDPETAARAYESTIRQEFAADAPMIPSLDVVLLGLGDDGHTASLFPSSPALDERSRLVVAAPSPVGIRQRITMTLPLLNQARVVLFLVTGAKKAAMVRKVLEPCNDEIPLPSARIHPTTGRLLWYLDEAAAADLSSRQRRVPEHEE